MSIIGPNSNKQISDDVVSRVREDMQPLSEAAAMVAGFAERMDEVEGIAADVNTRVDDVEPAAITAKERVIDLSDYVDITGMSDSTAGFQQAIDDALTGTGSRTLYLRSGAVVNIQAGVITIPDTGRNRITILGEHGFASQLIVTGPGPAIQFDPTATPTTATRRQYWRMENLYISGPGKSVAGSVGLHINNALLGSLYNVIVMGFETGVHVDGHNLVSGAANYYNDFYHLVASQCGTALKVSGQANTNRFYGGSFRNSTIGVHLENVNNVVFFGSDIESNSQYGMLLDAYQNQMFGVRFENPSATWEVHFTDSTSGGLRGRKNSLAYCYWSEVNPRPRLGGGALVSQNAIPTGLGLNEMGDVSSVSMPYGAHLSRSAVADGKPLVLLEDTNSTSGTPTGFEYRYARPGSKAFVASSVAGTERIAIALDSSGRPYIAMTNSVTDVTSMMRWLPISPEGVYAGNIGDVAFVNNTSAGVGGMYVKQTGSGNTGWVKK